MKIFGLSLFAILVYVFVFWLGTRFPNAFGSLPVIGK